MGGQFTLAMISFLGRDLPGSGSPSDDDDDDEVDGNDDDIVDLPGNRATSE